MDPVSQELLKKKQSNKKNIKIIIISSQISIRTRDAFGSGDSVWYKKDCLFPTSKARLDK